MTQDHHIGFALTIPSDPEEAAGVRRIVMQSMDRFGFEQADRFAVCLSLEEALANAIHHGNRSDRTKNVCVTVRAQPGHIELGIEDEGVGFQPDALPDCHDHLTKPSGRGVMLIQAYMDQVDYNTQGNRLTMSRRARGENRAAG